MGIRVNKFLGYGFTDLQDKDPRLNWDSSLLRHEYDRLSGDDYFRYLESRAGVEGRREFVTMDRLMLRTDLKLRQASLVDVVARHGDDGLRNVFAMRPVCYQDWHRCDDSLDYVAEMYLRDPGQTAHVEVLPAGIFPFNGRYMDARTGDVLSQDVVWFMRVLRSNASPSEGALDEIARDSTPFATAAEARENIVPLVPEEIQHICEYTSLLTEPNGWRVMRPLVYTWWA